MFEGFYRVVFNFDFCPLTSYILKIGFSMTDPDQRLNETTELHPLCITDLFQNNNLFVTSKNENTNSPIHQFTNLKCCIKAREPIKSPC